VKGRRRKRLAVQGGRDGGMDDRKLLVLFSASSVQVVNGMLYLGVMVLQELYMTDRF
jgi:hypothetical protein